MGMLFGNPATAPINLRDLYFNAPAPPVGMSAPKPTLADKVAGFVSSRLRGAGVSQRTAQRFGDKITAAADALTPFGAATSAQQAGRDYRAGHYGAAAANAAGALLSAIPDGGALTAKGAGVLHSIIAPLFHGSPHKFEKFALEKIGTGEGAQAYGHGLYFAENPQVAREYQKQTAGDGFLTAGGQVFDPATLGHMNVRSTLNRTGSLDEAIAKASGLLPSANSQTRPLLVHDLQTLTRLRENGGISRNIGHLYEVKLDANPEDFLDWDAPAIQQPSKVYDFLRKREGGPDALLGRSGFNYVKSGTYGDVSAAIPNEEWLNAGIPGVRYLDQGSRTAGNGTRNYVVFDPSIIDILKRN